MKLKHCLLAIALPILSLPALASDDDRPDHFKGKPANTLEQALANLAEYNIKLTDTLKQDSLTPAQLHEIHQITYTLENAIKRIDDELDDIEDALEEVHLASERADEKTVRSQGAVYLEGANKLTR